MFYDQDKKDFHNYEYENSLTRGETNMRLK